MKIHATKCITPCGAVVALVVLSSPVQATFLGPILTNPGVTSAPILPLPPGSIISNGGVATSAPIAAGSFTGTLTYAVYKETATGLLDFLFQVTNNASSMDSIHRVTMANFTGFQTAVSHAAAPTTAGFVTGTVASNSVDRNATGDTVGWNYPVIALEITPGSTTRVMVICTTATNFTTGTVSYINSGVASTAGYAPTLAQQVPEPTSFVLLASCFLGFGGAYAWRWKECCRVKIMRSHKVYDVRTKIDSPG